MLQSTDSVTKGILPVQRLEELVANGNIRASAPIGTDQIQPSSIDLRLGKTAYRVSASFLPTQYATVEQKLQDLVVEEVDLSSSAATQERVGIYCAAAGGIVPSGFHFGKGESKEQHRAPGHLHTTDHGLCRQI